MSTAPTPRPRCALHREPRRLVGDSNVLSGPRPGTFGGMDVRIGVTHVARELAIEISEEQRDDAMTTVEQVLAGDEEVLKLTDKRGRTYVVPVEKIGYVEVGSAEGDRRIGFSG